MKEQISDDKNHLVNELCNEAKLELHTIIVLSNSSKALLPSQ